MLKKYQEGFSRYLDLQNIYTCDFHLVGVILPLFDLPVIAFLGQALTDIQDPQEASEVARAMITLAKSCRVFLQAEHLEIYKKFIPLFRATYRQLFTQLQKKQKEDTFILSKELPAGLDTLISMLANRPQALLVKNDALWDFFMTVMLRAIEAGYAPSVTCTELLIPLVHVFSEIQDGKYPEALAYLREHMRTETDFTITRALFQIINRTRLTNPQLFAAEAHFSTVAQACVFARKHCVNLAAFEQFQNDFENDLILHPQLILKLNAVEALKRATELSAQSNTLNTFLSTYTGPALGPCFDKYPAYIKSVLYALIPEIQVRPNLDFQKQIEFLDKVTFARDYSIFQDPAYLPRIKALIALTNLFDFPYYAIGAYYVLEKITSPEIVQALIPVLKKHATIRFPAAAIIATKITTAVELHTLVTLVTQSILSQVQAYCLWTAIAQHTGSLGQTIQTFQIMTDTLKAHPGIDSLKKNDFVLECRRRLNHYPEQATKEDGLAVFTEDIINDCIALNDYRKKRPTTIRQLMNNDRVYHQLRIKKYDAAVQKFLFEITECFEPGALFTDAFMALWFLAKEGSHKFFQKEYIPLYRLFFELAINVGKNMYPVLIERNIPRNHDVYFDALCYEFNGGIISFVKEHEAMLELQYLDAWTKLMRKVNAGTKKEISPRTFFQEQFVF
jgi:hypothetical protein